jgi:GT2 family glycosyltransferase
METDMVKTILISIPLANNCDILKECNDSLNAISKYKTDKFKVRIVIAQTAVIGIGRNTAISASNKKVQTKFDFDYNLTVDADVAFTPENVEQLFDLCCEQGYDVVSGICPQRGVVEYANAGFWSGKPGCNGLSHTFKMTDSGIKTCDWLGTAFCMNSRKVYETMAYPWYWYSLLEDGETVTMLGEDIFYCVKLQELGLKHVVNCDCKVKHLL